MTKQHLKLGRFISLGISVLLNILLVAYYFSHQKFVFSFPFILLTLLGLLSLYLTFAEFDLGVLLFGTWVILVPVATITNIDPLLGLTLQTALPLLLVWSFKKYLGSGLAITWLIAIVSWLITESLINEFWPQLLVQASILILTLGITIDFRKLKSKASKSEIIDGNTIKADSVLGQDQLWDALVKREIKMLELKGRIAELEEKIAKKST